MSASIFDPEKGFWRLMSRVVDVLSLSLLWTFWFPAGHHIGRRHHRPL